jgi:Na+-driven multidrug efflux pump
MIRATFTGGPTCRNHWFRNSGSVDSSYRIIRPQTSGICTNTIAGLAMGTTVLIGQQIGKGEKENASRTMGVSIAFFILLAVVLTVVMLLNVANLANVMKAPAEAFSATCDYIRICGAGLIFIIGYNLIGSLFRGIAIRGSH